MTEKHLPLAKKIDQFTYGLLYPAFFGNMVYDLITAKTEHLFLKQLDFFTGLVILLFYALDYMHLYVDVDESVENKVENKTWRYIGCDITTSLLIFFAFVSLKEKDYSTVLILVGIIPAFIVWYKYEMPIEQPHKNVLIWFAIFSAVFAGISLFTAVDVKITMVFLLTLGQLVFYFCYVFFYYPNHIPSSK
jgi:hypothetical protein